jgi:hypothetical protein
VDDTLYEGRIEIELTANEPARRHRRASVTTAPAVRSTPPERVAPRGTAPAPRPPGRVLPIALAAGAGVLVGWLAGGTGGDGGTLAPAIVTTAAAAADDPPSTFAANPALVEPDAPVLTTAADRERPTTTTSPEVTSHLLNLDPRLLGQPYEIVTASSDGEIRYIDLARGMSTVIDGPGGADTGMLFAGDTWVLVPVGAAGAALLYEDGTPAPRRIEGIEPWGWLSLPGSPTLWMPDDNLLTNRPGQMVEVTPELEPTGVRVTVPAMPLMIEPPGNFVVPAASGVYVVSGDPASRLTTGRAIAVGPTVALAEECDEQLACGYVVIDRATDERRELPGLVRGAPLEPIGWWAHSSPAVSPDGRLAMVLLPEYERPVSGSGYMVTARLTVIDLTTGQTTPLTDESGNIRSVVRWTDDSRFAFFLAEGGLFAYVAESGEVLRAGPDGSSNQPQAFELRPSAGT